MTKAVTTGAQNGKEEGGGTTRLRTLSENCEEREGGNGEDLELVVVSRGSGASGDSDRSLGLEKNVSLFSDCSTSSIPGVLRTPKSSRQISATGLSQKSGTPEVKFFTSKRAKDESSKGKQRWREPFRMVKRGFRHVVLFKWLPKHMRKRLTIPILMTFWITMVIGVGLVYNIVLYIDSRSIPETQEVPGTCTRELKEIEDREKSADRLFIVNATYITFSSLLTIFIVMEVTGSLRYLGKALNKVVLKKDLTSIMKTLRLATDNATAETETVMQPIHSLVNQALQYRKRAEKAEARWAVNVRRVEMLKALIEAEKGPQNLPSISSQLDLTIFVSSWNVGNQKPSQSLTSWLGGASMCDIVVVGVQECSYGVGCGNHFQDLLSTEMGTDFVLMEHACLLDNLSDIAAIRIYFFVRKKHAPWVKDIVKQDVKRGVKVILNKGAVAIAAMVYGIRLCFINAHFQAHQNRVEERNLDFKVISEKMAGKLGDPGHHVVWFMGDLNYRIDQPHQVVVDHIQRVREGQEDWSILSEHDQLRKNRAAGLCFSGYTEPGITFMPTYKLNEDRSGYDLKRTPAWCDRILYKSNLVLLELGYTSDCFLSTSDHHPIMAVFRLPVFEGQRAAERVTICGDDA